MSVNTKVNGELVKSAGLYTVTKPIGMADIYSTEERQVGVFVDGKPLYQKTWTGLNVTPAYNNWTNIISNDDNIEKIVIWGALSGEDYKNIDGSGLEIQATTSHIRAEYNQNANVRAINVLTLQYTKTTDLPGSGQYVPSGDKAEHYSTNEEVIGTFMGETLYRKVIPITQNWDFTANTWVKSNIPQGNIKAIVNGRIEVFYQNTYSLHFVQLDFIDNMIAGNCFRAFSVSANGANLILEYTKTS